jgi:exoribonuclease-2
MPPDAADLPLSEAVAFSLDDIGTTEIDDAFSLRTLPDGTVRIGIHIAAPALAVLPGSPLDAIARERLSTAYMPGGKYTMLPEPVIGRFSLDEGTERAAVSLYFDLNEDGLPAARHSRLERIRVGANLRHSRYDVLNETLTAGRSAGLPLEGELTRLWQCALRLEAKRGKPSTSAAMLDYTFYVEQGRVRIVPRKRGSPLDKLVSEMMILVNTSWGELLAERDIAAIYRVQSTGKVRFSVHPEPHEGLGVSCYAWMSSPLRRYVDLLNQWQLFAALAGRKPPFARNSDSLLSALRAFEVTYTRYDEHQRGMENYWSLRWLLQEKVAHIGAAVIRENLLRVDGLPLVARVASLPDLAPGARVRLEVKSVDLLERTVEMVYRETLEEHAEVPQESTETGEKA